ncbi:MAG: beta-ketoacyl synthase chain length factor [Planctomycetes bacterium]|nr:beta-ketoacyl synthase chain length factor [Planctomycetota bacterium]
MNGPRVSILGVGIWQPQYPDTRSWRTQTAVPDAQKPVGQALDRVNRRRAGQLGRALADTAAEAMAMAGVDPATVPVIVGSSIGEATTMIGLLDQMWRNPQPMSPADFTVSVHNAASGLISIANKNRGMTTSLAADENTPAAALLEGIGMVAVSGGPVLIACGDEPAPENLAGQAPPWSMLAAAIVLGPADQSPRLGELRVTRGPAPTVRSDRFSPLAIANPQIGLGWLVDAVLHRHDGVIALDRGTGGGWVAQLSNTAR